MMEYFVLLLIGVFLVVTGVITFKGNIAYIHWYNRRKVIDVDKPKFAKITGSGVILAGASIAITAVLQMIFELEVWWWITLIGVILGVVFIGYGLIKYNRGIF